jgi:hypothetical protein
MKKSRNGKLSGLVLILITIGLIGCQSASVSLGQPVDVADSTIVEIAEQQIAAPPDTMLEEAAPPTTEQKIDYCLECHTDQQMLIDTAKPEAVVVSENEGEG